MVGFSRSSDAVHIDSPETATEKQHQFQETHLVDSTSVRVLPENAHRTQEVNGADAPLQGSGLKCTWVRIFCVLVMILRCLIL